MDPHTSARTHTHTHTHSLSLSHTHTQFVWPPVCLRLSPLSMANDECDIHHKQQDRQTSLFLTQSLCEKHSAINADSITSGSTPSHAATAASKSGRPHYVLAVMPKEGPTLEKNFFSMARTSCFRSNSMVSHSRG